MDEQDYYSSKVVDLLKAEPATVSQLSVDLDKDTKYVLGILDGLVRKGRCLENSGMYSPREMNS